jgi:hypothetical protein
MKTIEDKLQENYEKIQNGTLTIGDVIYGYFRLRNGPKSGRVVIITLNSRIDDRRILFYANSFTWDYIDNLKDTLCEPVEPTFGECKHSIDRIQAQWYGDDDSGPYYYEW